MNMKLRCGFSTKNLLLTAFGLFAASGALSFFGGFFTPSSFFGAGISTSVRGGGASNEGTFPVRSEEARLIFAEMARVYLDNAAQRLGDGFNAPFYQSVVDDGYKRLTDAVEIVPFISEAREESFCFLTALKDEEVQDGSAETIEGPAAGTDGAMSGSRGSDDRKADGWDAAVTFLTELQTTPVEAARTDAASSVSVPADNRAAPLSSPSWEIPLDLSAAFEEGNPLNALRPVFSDGSIHDSPPLAPPSNPTALLLGRRLAPAAHGAGWLFSLLSLVTAMTRPDGILAVLIGGAAAKTAEFFSTILNASPARFFYYFGLYLRTAGRPVPTISPPFLSADPRLTEKKSVVLLR